MSGIDGEYDVIVIGAGPAGATASAVLAENNSNVLLLEREKLPRPKVCGGLISKRSLNLLDSLGIRLSGLKTFKKCRSVHLGFFDQGKIEDLFDIEFDNYVGVLTTRDEFDHAIVQNATSRGAELKENFNVKNIKRENSHFIVKDDNLIFKSKYLLCADGVNSTSARLLRFRDRWKSNQVGLCIESEITEYETPPLPLNLYYGSVEWGYTWFFDKGDHAQLGMGTFTLGTVSNLRQLFDSFARDFRLINSDKNLKINAWMIPTAGGISKNLRKGNALLLGDAAGLVDPFIGEGIAYAIHSGKIAAECIINSEIEKYNERVDREITNDLGYARILMRIIKRNPMRYLNLISKQKSIGKEYAEVIMGNKTYKEFMKKTVKKVLMNHIKFID